MAPQTRTVALMRERRKVPTNPMMLALADWELYHLPILCHG